MFEKQRNPAPAVDQPAPASRPGKAKVLVAVSVLCALLWAITSPRLCSMMSPSAQNVTAEKLLEESPLIDTHNDFPIYIRAFYKNDIYQENFTSDGHLGGQVDFPRLKKGKLGAQFWSAFVPCPKDQSRYDDEVYGEAVHDTLQQIDLIHRMIEHFPDHLVAASSAADIRKNFANHGPKRISSLIGIEGLHQIGNSASTLRLYYSLGVRYATLTHVCHNAYADSEAPEKPLHGGLSPAGKDIVREMNRMGMIVDLSHTSAQAQRDALEVTLAPVMFSHSNALNLCSHTRNVPDDVLHLVKKNDGVVQVTFVPEFVVDEDKRKEVNMGDVVDHIQYIGNLIGYRHVGIGSDFDGTPKLPKDLEDVSKYPDLIDELLNRGVSVVDVKNIMGLNAIRVLEEVEKVAATLAPKMEPLQDKVKPLLP